MVQAHGIGGARDLPLPAEYAVAGAAAALGVSFVVLALAWRRSRFEGVDGGRPAPVWLARVVDHPLFAGVLRGLGMAFFLYVGWAALAGPDLLVNPVFGVFYVILWVGIVPASLLAGPFYRAVNPVRTIHLVLSRLTGGDPERGLVSLPRWVGCWPAALALFAFVWFELVFPGSTYLAPVRLWLAAYVAIGVLGAAVFGSGWVARFDPFEAYSTLVGRLSVFGRRTDGALVLRSPLDNLDGTPVLPGLTAVVSVLLGSTAFDSFQDSSFWLQLSQAAPVGSTVLDTAALVGFCALVGALFAAATMATGIAEDLPRASLPDRFAHAVVPIVVGYIAAHYLSYLVEVGQQTLVLLSDPMGTGADYLGTADLQVSYWLSEHPTLLAVTKVLAVVTGHVLGVVASHDRAVRLLPTRHRLTGQLPLLVVMVVYTVGGLLLLFGG